MPKINTWTVMCVLRAMPTQQLEIDGDIIYYDPDADLFRDGDGKPVDAPSWIDDHRRGIRLA